RGDAVPGMTNEGLGDTGEVVEDFALGRPRLRVEDLVEIAKRQPMAVDGDLLLWHGHLLCAARLLAFPAAHGGVPLCFSSRGKGQIPQEYSVGLGCQG